MSRTINANHRRGKSVQPETQRHGRLQQLIRCHHILARLASPPIDYTVSLLAEELGFTPKTIFRDLRALRAAGVLIDYDRKRKVYQLAESHLVRAYLGNGNGSVRTSKTSPQAQPTGAAPDRRRKGHRGETCARAIRRAMKVGEILTFSELWRRLKRRGSWKDFTVWQHLMSLVVNLPPARHRWASAEPFLFLHGDGRYELFDAQVHPQPRD